ncbi:MAG: beta-mannosidase [Actinomycetota bacterium]|nr:beta-mannosidase [Actinomycetota bacterium]
MLGIPTSKATVALLSVLGVAALSAPTASAETSTVGLGGWQVQSSAQATQSGAKISNSGFAPSSWLLVRPDGAGAVGTEVGALVQNGRCPNVFFSINMKTCFGYMNQVGPDTIPMFAVPWWFRTDFTSHLRRSQHAQLIINGVVGDADLWVNGARIASRGTVEGAFTKYTFDITRILRPGANAVALKVYPNDPNKMFTLDNVDWTQIPPDNNTGIQFPIQLHTSGPLALSNAHVMQHNAPDLSRSKLTLKADISNDASTRQTGQVSAVVSSPSGASIQVRRTVSLPAGTTRTIAFTPADDPRLLIHHPRVWWPYQMGGHPLYGLRMTVSQPGAAPDTQSDTFGIRTITTRLIGASPIAPHGSRQFLVNGDPFVFRGGGWSEDLFLRYSSTDTADQIALIKNLGLDGIRTEGKQMPDDFYEQMDRAGILIDGGFQCCDAWQLPDNGKGVTSHDYAVLYLSARTIGEDMRNHPSVINFSWSDNNPIPRQETVSLKGFKRADFQDPLISSAEYKSTPRLGPSGEKEGPYDWVPPGYWYDTTHFDPGDPSRTNVGGSWAFDSEASAGHTVPTMDSIKRFLSPFEQLQLWQTPDYNQYHANYEAALPGPDNGGYSFGTLHDLDKAITSRYGAWSSLAGYVQEAQVQNYETQRAEFEAYIDHSTNRAAPSTGIVYWQLNKGWPTLLWDLYNHDFDQAGSYFGAKKANKSLHALYAYDNRTVALDNLTGVRQNGLSVESKVYNLAGKLLDDRTASGLTLQSQGVANGVLHPSVPETTVPPAPASTYFVELVLSQRGVVVDRNVYWLSTQQDLVNWSKTMGNPQATMLQSADLTQLKSLPTAQVRATARTRSQPGTDGADTVTEITITNTSSTSTVAFFLRADVRRGTASGSLAAGDNEVLPIFWSNNDVTLWPGESETLRASYRRSDLRGASAAVSVAGWNVPVTDVAAPG